MAACESLCQFHYELRMHLQQTHVSIHPSSRKAVTDTCMGAFTDACGTCSLSRRRNVPQQHPCQLCLCSISHHHLGRLYLAQAASALSWRQIEDRGVTAIRTDNREHLEAIAG